LLQDANADIRSTAKTLLDKLDELDQYSSADFWAAVDAPQEYDLEANIELEELDIDLRDPF
jgi:hypothetical protein